ncbi:hypothetical protein ABZ820_04970 [Streptomyces diacarni]|uniref:hypothetical protein n=1 Tax=Streptomyces diacarni TaxID=2800381 RepID=UPI0033E2A6E2
MTAHLADWYLTRLDFEPVPHQPGLYRLTRPEYDAQRRAGQAVSSLRALGFAVQADYALEPAQEPARTGRADTQCVSRSRVARAAAARSPHTTGCGPPRPRTGPTTSPPPGRPPTPRHTRHR